MMCRPWETPFHPAQTLSDFWTMMNPAWQAQMLDPSRLMENFRAMASTGFDPASLMRHQRDTFEKLAEANLAVAEMYRAALEGAVDLMMETTRTMRIAGNAANDDATGAYLEAQSQAVLSGLSLTKDVLRRMAPQGE